MKNDSLGTGAYIALGEERDSETWLNKLFTSCAFFNDALGCPCGCRRCFCRKRGRDGIRFLPCPPCFKLPCHLPRTELACSICSVPFGCQRFESLTESLKSTSHGTNVREDAVEPGVKDKKVCGTGRKLPCPQAPTSQTLLLSHEILLDIAAAPPDPAGILSNERFFLLPAQLLSGKSVEPSFLNFLSLLLPSCVTGLSPNSTKLERAAGKQLQKNFCSFCSPSFFYELHHRAMGSAILIPAFGWSLSAAFDVS